MNTLFGEAYTKQEVKDILTKSDKAVYRALELLCENEKSKEEGKGFDLYDKSFMLSMMTFYKKFERLYPDQIKIVRDKLKKYTTQILESMEAKGKTVIYR